MLVPHPRTTYYIDPDRTSREPGQGNVTPSRPRAPTLNMCSVAADGSQRPPDEREAGAAPSLHVVALATELMDFRGSV